MSAALASATGQMRHDGQMPGGRSEPADAAPVACTWCGTTVAAVPVTWTVQGTSRGVEYLCEACTRDNVRQIEGSLPTEYW